MKCRLSETYFQGWLVHVHCRLSSTSVTLFMHQHIHPTTYTIRYTNTQTFTDNSRVILGRIASPRSLFALKGEGFIVFDFTFFLNHPFCQLPNIVQQSTLLLYVHQKYRIKAGFVEVQSAHIHHLFLVLGLVSGEEEEVSHSFSVLRNSPQSPPPSPPPFRVRSQRRSKYCLMGG